MGWLICLGREYNVYKNNKISEELEDYIKLEPYRKKNYIFTEAQKWDKKCLLNRLTFWKKDLVNRDLREKYSSYINEEALRAEMISLESKYLPYKHEKSLEEHRQEAYDNLKIRLLKQVLIEEENKYKKGEGV